MGRWLIGFCVVIALAATFWSIRAEIVLSGFKYLAELNSESGPNQVVTWQQGPKTPTSAPEERPPNIILILADDLGWNDVSTNGGGAGNGIVRTPNIDRLAAEGVNFTTGYAGNATCAPSRAAILSGRYGTRFGFEFTPTPSAMWPLMNLVRSTDPTPRRAQINNPDFEPLEFEEMGMPTSEITIAEVLKEAGYYTAHIGKWHVGESNGMAAYDQGFDDSLLMRGLLHMAEQDPEVVNAKQLFDPIDRFIWSAGGYGVSFNGGPAFDPVGHTSDYYTDEAIKVIEANKNRPFFLYLAHWAIHTPLQTTLDDYDAYSSIEDHTERTYAGMIHGLDRSLGRVLEALEQQGLTDNTIVIFTSDNGGAGYVGLPDVNAPFRGWKLTFFEGGIHVPFMMRWPAKIAPNQTFTDAIHHLDIFTTAANAAGAAIPNDRKMDGVDLLPFIQGEAEGVPHDTLFWTQDNYQVIRHEGWKLQLSGPNKEFTWLFNLNEDPTEQVNLAAQRADKVEALSLLLSTHLAEQATPRWPHRSSNPIAIDKHLNQPEEISDEFVYYPN